MGIFQTNKSEIGIYFLFHCLKSQFKTGSIAKAIGNGQMEQEGKEKEWEWEWIEFIVRVLNEQTFQA